MNLKKIRDKQIAKERKEQERREFYKRMHIAEKMIRKLDQSIPYIKDYNQKHPADRQLVPCGKIHKVTVR